MPFLSNSLIPKPRLPIPAPASVTDPQRQRDSSRHAFSESGDKSDDYSGCASPAVLVPCRLLVPIGCVCVGSVVTYFESHPGLSCSLLPDSPNDGGLTPSQGPRTDCLYH